MKRFERIIVTGSTRIVSCLVIEDPNYRQPWVLVTDLIKESAETIYRLYRSRWKIEQLPQTAKQLLGGQRAFVHGDECRYRLPEVCLLAATLSLYFSATCEAVASGFWERNPKRTPEDYAVSSPQQPAKTCQNFANFRSAMAEFAKNAPPMSTSRREYRDTGGYRPQKITPQLPETKAETTLYHGSTLRSRTGFQK